MLFSVALTAQTFEISPQTGEAAPSSPQPGRANRGGSGSSGQNFGWGSSIEVARQARAAEDALRRGDYGSASMYAQRAANAAPQDAHLWFLLGYAARMTGNHALSVSSYERGLKLQPGSVEGLSGLAQTYVRMGRAEDAKAVLLKVIAANPRRPNELVVAGELFLQSGDNERALQLLGRAESIAPSSRIELLMAIAYQRSSQQDRAKAMLERARGRDPRNPEVLRAVAGYHREVKEYSEAVAALEQIRNPGADILGEIGYSYELAGRPEPAAKAYGSAAQAAPQQLNLQLAAAGAYISAGDFETATSFLDRAAAIDANHYRVHSIRGEIYRHQRQIPDAIKAYTLAIQSLPGSVNEGVLYPVQLRINLGELYRENGDDESARQQFSTALSAMQQLQVQQPQRPDYLRMRGAIKASLGDFPGADADLKEAASLAPKDPNILLQLGGVQWKLGQKAEARRTYENILAIDSGHASALTALGYLARDLGEIEAAEQYFHRLANAHPDNHVPYLALGDMYTSLRRFEDAQKAYEKAHTLDARNPMIIAGGANAGIEAHELELANGWLQRASADAAKNPFVMREKERYLSWTGNYEESAHVGEQVIQKLPRDRDAVVYLGYDLLFLDRYEDLLKLTARYIELMPDEPDLPLLAGYIYKRNSLLHEAYEAFSETLRRDPKIVTAYVNRGYILNDLQNAEAATTDFRAALKFEPDNGEAHLGLAYAQLELRHPRVALEHLVKAEKSLGESGATHVARATAYRQQGLLTRAEESYRAAIEFRPNDLKLELALAEVLYDLRRYRESFDMLSSALRLSPNDPVIYAQMAHAQAQMGNTQETLRYIEEAEKQSAGQTGILISTGNALLILGNRQAAMERFSRALDAPDSDRIEARLAVARAMQSYGEDDAAREQVSLAFAESRIGEASPITLEHLMQAGDLFLRMKDFELAERMFQRARDAGAPQETVAIALANTYLAHGNHGNAEAELASLGNPEDLQHNYDYMLARANLLRQRREDVGALTAFARAEIVSGEDTTAARQLEELAGQEGLRINERFSLLSDFSIVPEFEDATIYAMDSRFFGGMPPPRHTIETRWTNSYRIHQEGIPTISGFFQLRNSRGQISLPAQNVITDRNTYDYSFNGALNPVLRMGRNSISFNTGLQYTIRRDQKAPEQMNQNLFRQFLYFSTNSLGNWLSISGYGIHESGPFTDNTFSSRDLSGRLEFRVGRPWGKTALITGYWVRDLLFDPMPREWFSTSTYGGLERQFGESLRLRAVAEYIRGWRVQDRDYVMGQALRPAVDFTYRATRNWQVDGSFSYSRGMGIHEYDNAMSGVFVSYVRALRRTHEDGGEQVPIDYPLRFSVGLQQQHFFNFAGGRQSTYLPIVRVTLF
ncbi:MAG: tetratricopeptide repeat protein [Candidatus Korobacteraceae bacterium]